MRENEAAWEAVQVFVERVTETTPSEARPELVEALADLAKEVPQVASAGMRGLAYHARPVTKDSVRDQLDFLADEPGRTQKKVALLLISRTPLANDALRILNATSNIYAVVIEGLQDREKLATAIYNALGQQQTGRYFL